MVLPNLATASLCCVSSSYTWTFPPFRAPGWCWRHSVLTLDLCSEIQLSSAVVLNFGNTTHLGSCYCLVTTQCSSHYSLQTAGLVVNVTCFTYWWKEYFNYPFFTFVLLSWQNHLNVSRFRKIHVEIWPHLLVKQVVPDVCRCSDYFSSTNHATSLFLSSLYSGREGYFKLDSGTQLILLELQWLVDQ